MAKKPVSHPKYPPYQIIDMGGGWLESLGIALIAGLLVFVIVWAVI